ncbi:MAG TPA: clostripain-related cysteine peptidase [Pyrinomonadaceae bacterium]|nr:clostripain-related cysteine peptidase [Pyrinomonadaceae bacterium]
MAEKQSSTGTPKSNGTAQSNRSNGNSETNGNLLPRCQKPIWTILVYLAGDSNLTANCISVLQQLEEVEYTDEVCVLACFDSNTPWPRGSRYLEINARRRRVDTGIDWEIHNDLVPPEDRNHMFIPPSFCEEINHGPTTPPPPSVRDDVAQGLRRFLDWAVNQHEQTERYMLIFYGHGPLVAGQTFLARENPKSSLLFKDLQAVLGDNYFGPHRKLDILAFQNCVMNGIETAYEVRDQVDVIIGSQGLVLAAGWPYQKLIKAIVKRPAAPLDLISRDLLKACARHLIDFSIMDRSSEQSVCDVRRLAYPENVIEAIRDLVEELNKGLVFDEDKKLQYPAIADVLRLARLEAQSYWGETFVDLYDFCERLLKRCNTAVRTLHGVVEQCGYNGELQYRLKSTDLVERFREIIRCSIEVMERVRDMVPYSYYIGPDLQYSHGLSIFFPWTMPGEPYFFEQKGSEYILKTAFESYSEYSFVKESGWGVFLKNFYKATLRKVRRADRRIVLRDRSDSLNLGMIQETFSQVTEVLTSDLQKSSSTTGITDHEVWSYVKNYPRRNYLAPTDCEIKILEPGCQKVGTRKEFRQETSPPVSYLGWNISGLVAEVITKKPLPCSNGGGNGAIEPKPVTEPVAATVTRTATVSPSGLPPKDQ